MILVFLIFGLILLSAAAIAWLVGNPGSVTMAFQAWEVTTSFAFLMAVVAGLMMASGGLVFLVGVIARELPLVGKNRQIRRHQKGLDLINNSLVALTAGDFRLAEQLVTQAELLLPPQPMVHLIAAEAALKAGAHDRARDRFRLLEESDGGRLIGLRGLVQESRRVGRSQEALRLVRRALEDNRKSPWVLQTLFSLEVEAGNWAEAQSALDRVTREKLLSPDQINRHRGALHFAQAVEQGLEGAPDKARKSYELALKARPHFAPAVAALVRLDLQAGQKRRARNRLYAAWEKAPRPILARLFKEMDVAESGKDWLKRVKDLVARNPGHRESDLLLADAALDARFIEEATPVIARLSEKGADRAVWQLKLRLATLEGKSTDAIEEALETATELPRWHCQDCHTPQRDWVPLCPNCKGFDTLVRGRSDYRIVAPDGALPRGDGSGPALTLLQ